MSNKNRHKTFKTLLMLSITSMMLILGGIIPVHAHLGDVLDIVEINSTTLGGPTLDDGDRFGASVSNIGDLDGNGVNDIVVGAWGDDTPSDDDPFGYNRGAIHVILLNADGTPKSTVVINDSTLNGPILNDSDWFGMSVSNIGDLDENGVNDIVVGAHGDDAGGEGRGTVHIILLNADGSPKRTVEINSTTLGGPTLDDLDLFGKYVSNIGDLDENGVNDILVGAPNDSEGGNRIGTVHIILLNADGSPKRTVEINSTTLGGPTLDDGDWFGVSVSNIDDLDENGVNDIVVGAHGDDAGGIDRGTVHIILLNVDGSPKRTVEINSTTLGGPTLDDGDLFGKSVSNIDDLDENGVNDIVVGAYLDDAGGIDRGTVHIILLNDDGIGSPKHTVEINSNTINGPLLDDGDHFGRSVSNIGDLDENGVNDIVVGAYLDDAGGIDRGTVHIIFLGLHEDLYCGQPESYYNVISGTESPDYLLGTNSPDLIFGNGGNDMIRSFGENNCIYAGDGDDFVLANKDGNTVYGGADNDSILLQGTGIAYGENGDDSIYIIKPSTGHLIDGGNNYDLCITNGVDPIDTKNCEIVKP